MSSVLGDLALTPSSVPEWFSLDGPCCSLVYPSLYQPLMCLCLTSVFLQSGWVQKHHPPVWGERGDGLPGSQGPRHDGSDPLRPLWRHPFTGECPAVIAVGSWRLGSSVEMKVWTWNQSQSELDEMMIWFLLQSISSPGSGIWSDGKDKNDVSQPHTWNVEVFIDIVKEVVSELCIYSFIPTGTLPD